MIVPDHPPPVTALYVAESCFERTPRRAPVRVGAELVVDRWVKSRDEHGFLASCSPPSSGSIKSKFARQEHLSATGETSVVPGGNIPHKKCQQLEVRRFDRSRSRAN